VARYVTEDVDLHGQTVPAGSALLLMLASANRDERRFNQPDRFDIHRNEGQHATFGHGAHFCLGAALARLESRVALEETFKRFPTWDVDESKLEMVRTVSVRGYSSVPFAPG
jgi:cytochrome P450